MYRRSYPCFFSFSWIPSQASILFWTFSPLFLIIGSGCSHFICYMPKYIMIMKLLPSFNFWPCDHGKFLDLNNRLTKKGNYTSQSKYHGSIDFRWSLSALVVIWHSIVVTQTNYKIVASISNHSPFVALSSTSIQIT